MLLPVRQDRLSCRTAPSVETSSTRRNRLWWMQLLPVQDEQCTTQDPKESIKKNNRRWTLCFKLWQVTLANKLIKIFN